MRGGCCLVVGLLVLSLATAVPPARADTSPPEGTIQWPLPGGWARVQDFDVYVMFTDPDGIDQSSLALYIDGIRQSISFHVFDANWTHVQVFGGWVEEGLHTAEIRAKDLLGNGPTVLTWSFRADGTPPVVNLTAPAGDPLLADGSWTVAWTGSDVGSGIDRYEVALDGGPAIGVGTATSFTFRGLLPGVHYVEVAAFDVAGNRNAKTAMAVASVRIPVPGSHGNGTDTITVNVPSEVPLWAVVLIFINGVEAAAIAWVALRRRREPAGTASPPP